MKSINAELAQNQKNDVASVNPTVSSKTPLIAESSEEDRLKHVLQTLSERYIGKRLVHLRKTIIKAEHLQRLVKVHPLNPRRQKLLNSRALKKLQKEIEEAGNRIVEPILCYYDGTTYWALDGSRRTKCSSLMSIDLPILFFTDDVGDENIKACIQSIDSQEQISIVDKLCDAIDVYEALVKERAGTQGYKESECIAEAIVALGIEEPSKSTIGRYKKVLQLLREEFFTESIPTNITKFQLTDMANYLDQLRKSLPNYASLNLKELFDSVFIELDETHKGEYDGADAIKALKAKFQRKPVQPSSKTRTLIDNAKCEINLITKPKGWEIKSKGIMTEDFESELEALLKKHFE